MRGHRRWLVAFVAALAVIATGCGNAQDEGSPAAGGARQPAGGEGDEALSGTIEVDGSSTVEPLTTAVAEEYSVEQPEVLVNVGVSGTGGGFERFCRGETDISNASRPIKPEEAALCEQGGVEFVELQVGTDALSVITSPQTDFATCLTTAELAKIFGPDAPATTWNQVRPDFPATPLAVFAPDTDSGTYDFMVADILGVEAARQDYNASADDNIILQGVSGTPGSWGFLGYAYYQNNQDRVKAFEIDGGEGCVAPSVETAQDGTYPLTRPLFVYVKREALQRPEVAGFVTYYLDNVQALIEDVGYVPETEADLEETRARLQEALSGGTGDGSGGAESARE
jgi:phosphate transport system substrate-binding protein